MAETVLIVLTWAFRSTKVNSEWRSPGNSAGGISVMEIAVRSKVARIRRPGYQCGGLAWDICHTRSLVDELPKP